MTLVLIGVIRCAAPPLQVHCDHLRGDGDGDGVRLVRFEDGSWERIVGLVCCYQELPSDFKEGYMECENVAIQLLVKARMVRS